MRDFLKQKDTTIADLQASLKSLKALQQTQIEAITQKHQQEVKELRQKIAQLQETRSFKQTPLAQLSTAASASQK